LKIGFPENGDRRFLRNTDTQLPNYPEDGSFIRNISINLLNYTAPYLRERHLDIHRRENIKYHIFAMIAKDGLVSFNIRPSLFLDKITPDTFLLIPPFRE
jgi:hypothetical protein